MKRYTIVLADDHAMLREGIRKIIDASEALEVVGEASDGATLMELLQRRTPDMVILDVAMPKRTGIEAAQDIRQQFPDVAILFLSMHKSREYLQKALAVGARGYVLKEDSGTELLNAIQTIQKGGSYLSSLMMALSEDLTGSLFDGTQHGHEDPLTPREGQILQLIAEGQTSKEIARRLFISIHTVHNHRKNIKQKLGFRNNADLVKYALKHGYAL